MILLPKQSVNSNNNNTIVSRTSSSSNATNDSNFIHNIKRMSIIDRGKVWARQFINKKQQTSNTVSNDSSLLTSSNASLILTPPASSSSVVVDSSSASSSLSISLTTASSNSSSASPISLSPISKRISLIQVSPQNYYYYQHDNGIFLNSSNSSNNTIETTTIGTTSNIQQQDIQSPQDENGYLIPITIIDLNEIQQENRNNSKNSNSNLRRQSSMKVERQSLKKKDNRIQLRKKTSFNGKDDLNNQQQNLNLKQQLLKKTRRFSDLSFNTTNSTTTSAAATAVVLPLLKKIEINNLTATTTTTGNKSINNLKSQKLYNICELNYNNNDNKNNKFDDIKRNLNDYIDNNKKCLISNSKVILTKKMTGITKKASNIKTSNNNSSDDSIIYIDSIDNIEIDRIDNKSTSSNTDTNSDTSGFMTTISSNSSNSSNSNSNTNCCNRCGSSLRKSSLKIRVDNSNTHDYHAIDEYDSKQHPMLVLVPPVMPPPPPPLTNSIDSLDYILKIKKQQQIDENITNCYEKSWENSTNFLIDKLLNKYNHQQNFLHINNNTSSSSSSSDTNSCVNSNRNSSTSTSSGGIISNQQQQQLHLLSPTNTLSSTNSFKLFNNTILVPPQIPPPPPPLPLSVDTTTRLKTKVKSRNRDEGRHLIRLSNNYDDKETDLIIFDENTFSPSIKSNTIDSKNSSLCLSDIENEFEDLHEIWYQPTISRDTVQNVLSALEVGAFLIRYSNSCKDCFALSIRVPYFANPTGVAHYLITKNENGYKLKGVEKEFKSLKSLVTHYSVMQEILPVTLNLNFAIKNMNIIGNQFILSENHTKKIFDNLNLVK